MPIHPPRGALTYPLALIVVLVLAGPAQAAPGEVAFVTPDGLYAMQADGSDRHLLVDDDNAGSPAWSPDGTRLAYVQGGRIMIDGQAVTTPPKDGEDGAPAWSPDGRTLAFSRVVGHFLDADRRTQIVLYEGVSERVLVEQRIDDVQTSIGGPSFSPDGARIAYTRTRLDDEQIYTDDVFTIPVVGGMPKLLVREAYSAVWSPDGSRLAFASIADRNGIVCDEGEGTCVWSPELYVAAGDGSGARRLTFNQGSDGGPAWSPDGTRILFDSNQNLPEGDAYEVYSVAPDGSCETWITNGTPSSFSPSVRPGSGDTFDPGSCNPADHPLRPELPKPMPFAGGLWLGPRFDGLLATRMYSAGEVDYTDCEHFEARRCPPPIRLSAERSCGRTSAYLGGATFTRRGAAVLAYTDKVDPAYLFSGNAVTSINIGSDGTSNTRARVRQVAAALRPYTASRATRLRAPRVPRALARRFARTAPGPVRRC